MSEEETFQCGGCAQTFEFKKILEAHQEECPELQDNSNKTNKWTDLVKNK